MRSKSHIALFGLFICLGLWFYAKSEVEIIIEEPSGKSSVIHMPRKDAWQLDCFFRELMISEPLAYTLAGCKPMSFAGYRQIGSSLASFFFSNVKIIRGWEVWQKYQHQFANGRIQFWKEKSPWVKGMFWLIVADMENCDQTIQKYAIDFKQVIGESPICTQHLFQKVATVSFFQDVIHQHDALIGILLGFGRGNAWLYYERSNSLTFKRLPEIWGPLMEQEKSKYRWKCYTFQTLDMSDLLLPIFVGDPDSEESKQLKVEYLEAREKIRRFYQDKDFLSATLSLYKHGPLLLERLREDL